MAKQWTRSMVALALVAGAGACGKGDNSTGPQAQTFVANLSPANEVSLKTPSQASGTATFTVTGNQIVLTGLTVQNIDSVTASHIHLAAAGVNGPIAVPLLALTPASGHISSQALLSNMPIDPSVIISTGGGAPAITVDSLLVLFRNGGAYVNVHTKFNPAGEMRGQIRLQ